MASDALALQFRSLPIVAAFKSKGRRSHKLPCPVQDHGPRSLACARDDEHGTGNRRP